MTQKHSSDGAGDEKSASATAVIRSAGGGVAAGLGEIGAGLGALYAALARFTLTGFEDISDRRAENRAAHLRRRAKTVRAAVAKDNS